MSSRLGPEALEIMPYQQGVWPVGGAAGGSTLQGAPFRADVLSCRQRTGISRRARAAIPRNDISPSGEWFPLNSRYKRHKVEVGKWH